ncbi:TatD family hydrolase [Asticcacaulis machinosus]|uniref:TatD family hydrolase n=1 Tax=Asticcacaulis machinosus TaxID=2984211 RepID=A0ABT5HF43_9CAUL|nr:TatD family hydrolase [Asticcacaulis machinosus]MDC7674857.1 TatD family hydrolase [Asticcacaulis machinosus]
MYIDSHVNLHAAQYEEDRDEVIGRARAAGVRLMVNICDRVSNFNACYAVAEAYDDIWATVGTHPHEAKEDPGITVDGLLSLAKRPKVVGIGECGLDFHYDYSPRDIQAKVFRTHIQAARESGLALVVHTREADAEMWDILHSEHRNGEFKFLLHCYTSGPDLARRAADIGAWFSVSGIATFKAAQDVRDIIKNMPKDRIIVETDCPYLAPVPWRGRRNEPACVTHVYDKLADIRGWSLDETKALTDAAFFELFDRIPKPIT